jgi:DNA-binding CsgD family transcriptional regulator/GAF domain-containing protein
MKFAPLIAKFSDTASQAQLRSCFIDDAGELVGAKVWGIDLLDRRFQIIESDLHGLPDHFRDRYQEIGREADWISQRMIQDQIPLHNLSLQSSSAWQQSNLYQQLFRSYGLEHGLVAPLIGSSGLIGGIYFLRDQHFLAFDDNDLIQISCLCQHLSVRLATLAGAISSSGCLTRREQEIVALVAEGLSNREIGLQLFISRDAVKQSLKRIFRKLDVSARAEMIAKLKS